MDSFVALVDNLQKNVLGQFGNSEMIERQKIASDAHHFYEQLSAHEEVQNVLAKFDTKEKLFQTNAHRLQLFQIREVNAESARRANVCSTRMGRVQQQLNEHAARMAKLEQLLRPAHLQGWARQLEVMGRQMRELERHLLQAELAMTELERLDTRHSPPAHEEQRQKRIGSEEELLGDLAGGGTGEHTATMR